MKKLSVFALASVVMMNGAFANEALDMQIRLLEMEVVRLTDEKRTHFETLEECASKVDGFRIAGISLLGLTAVGATVNVIQYTRIQRNRDTLDARAKAALDAMTKERDALRDAETSEMARINDMLQEITDLKLLIEQYEIRYGKLPQDGSTHGIIKPLLKKQKRPEWHAYAF